MKEDINLLPPLMRKNRALRVRIQRWSAAVRWVNIGLICLILILGAGQFYLQKQTSSIANSSSASPTPSIDPIKKAQDMDLIVNAIRMQARRLSPQPWPLTDIFKVLPQGVVITGLTQAESTKQITIKGTAPSSEAVVLFKKQLLTLPWIRNVNLPLNNFTVPIEEFTLTVIP